MTFTVLLIQDDDLHDVRLQEGLLSDAGLGVKIAKVSSEVEIIAAAQQCDAIVSRNANLTGRVLHALPRLKIVSRQGVGFDSVSAADARSLGIWVSNVPDYGFLEVASHGFAMALSLTRHLAFFDRDVRRGVWDHGSTGSDLKRPSTMTVGLLGVGRTGRCFANLAAPLFGKIVGYDPFLKPEQFPAGVQVADTIESIFELCDIVSLHLPLNDETHNIVGTRMLNLMKRGSFIVNVGRGPLIDPEALLEALNSGHIAGAALDVLPTEPPAHNDPLVHHPRTLVSPHAAFYSVESYIELRTKTAQNVVTYARTGKPDYTAIAGTRTPE